MTLAPTTLLLVVASFIVGALLGWVLQRASARQSVARMRHVMVGEVSRLQDRLDQCTSDLTAETRALGQARNHGEDLRTSLSASETRRQKLESEVARLEATVERLTNGLRGGADELRRLRASNQERTQALDDVQASASEVAEELQSTQVRLNETLRSLAEAAAQNARLEEHLAVARRVADVAREQVDALAAAERRVDALEKQLQAVQRGDSRTEIDPIGPASRPAGPGTEASHQAAPDFGAPGPGVPGPGVPGPGVPGPGVPGPGVPGPGVPRPGVSGQSADRTGQHPGIEPRTASEPESIQGRSKASTSTQEASERGDGPDIPAAASAVQEARQTPQAPKASDQAEATGHDSSSSDPGHGPAMEQLVEALGAGIREIARKFDESLRNHAHGDDPFDRLDEKMRREAQRFARRHDAAGRFEDGAPRQGLFERLLGEVLDEVRRERRR